MPSKSNAASSCHHNLTVVSYILTRLKERTARQLVATPTHRLYRHKPTDVGVAVLASVIVEDALEHILWERIKLSRNFDTI